MLAQKLVVGQKVAFDPELGQLANRGEVFVVVHQLPETDGMFQVPDRARSPGNPAHRPIAPLRPCRENPRSGKPHRRASWISSEHKLTPT
jgi:hypothetical protein